MKKMKAVFKTGEGKGRAFTELREATVPEPREGEVLVKVAATSICGTDRHIYNWDPSMAKAVKPPRIYGHEFCGHIEAFGPHTAAPALKEGDYVSAEMHLVCGTCYQCRTGRGHICANTVILGVHDDGCFAEFVRVPVSNITKLDASLPTAIGSFLDALGNAVHTLQPVQVAGMDVLILGYGPIGAMCASLCEFLGARTIVITEISPKGIAAAEEWIRSKNLGRKTHLVNVKGMSVVDQAQAIRAICPEGIDTVLEISGAEAAINAAAKAIKRGGEFSLLGIPGQSAITFQDYTNDLIFKGVTLYAIAGRRMFGTWYAMLSYLKGGLDVSHIPNAVYPGLDSFHVGMERFEAHDALKVVFKLA
jgi:threonine 3-dehydrogenase